MNILKTDIIEAKYDALWDDISFIINDATPKPVLVLVSGCKRDSPEDAQLQKMLEACKLTAAQYNIIRMEDGQQAGWHKLREKINPKIIFLIGVMPAQLGISAMFRLNERNNFNDRVWLPTLSLSELEKNADSKKQLWISGMKPVFIDNPDLM